LAGRFEAIYNESAVLSKVNAASVIDIGGLEGIEDEPGSLGYERTGKR
jgi:hypothetical protein